MEILLRRLDIIQLLAGLGLSAVIALISFRFRMLSLSGSIGTIIVGTIIFGLGGYIFAIPLLFFYISSSLLSAIKNPGKKEAYRIFEKSGPRDFWQVMANGGVGTIFVIIYFLSGHYIWFFPYLASICEASADTWGTELGTLSSNPVSITTLKSVERGQSGGVSAAGLLASLIAAIATMLVALPARGSVPSLPPFTLGPWLIAANSGFAGAIFDSILGASLQAQYRCQICERISEKSMHCGLPAKLVRGYRFINNDVVNFASTAFAALMALSIFMG